jgi:hypothetical protein
MSDPAQDPFIYSFDMPGLPIGTRALDWFFPDIELWNYVTGRAVASVCATPEGQCKLRDLLPAALDHEAKVLLSGAEQGAGPPPDGEEYVLRAVVESIVERAPDIVLRGLRFVDYGNVPSLALDHADDNEWEPCLFAPSRRPDLKAWNEYAASLPAGDDKEELLRRRQPRDLTCSATLLDLTARDLPDHVCPETLRLSVLRYAQNRRIRLDMPVPIDLTAIFLHGWPLPLGTRAIEQFLNDNAKYSGNPPVARQSVPSVLFALPDDAFVGLVVERTYPSGRVTLFGMTSWDAEAATWRFADAPVVHTTPVVGSEGRNKSLADSRHELEHWYGANVRRTRVGRGRGNKILTADDIPRYAKAVEACMREYNRINDESVAKQMQVSPGTLKSFRSENELPSPTQMKAKILRDRQQR